MRKKSKAALRKILAKAAFYGALIAVGMALGILYCNSNPILIDIEGHCEVQVPEWLIPT